MFDMIDYGTMSLMEVARQVKMVLMVMEGAKKVHIVCLIWWLRDFSNMDRLRKSDMINWIMWNPSVLKLSAVLRINRSCVRGGGWFVLLSTHVIHRGVMQGCVVDLTNRVLLWLRINCQC